MQIQQLTETPISKTRQAKERIVSEFAPRVASQFEISLHQSFQQEVQDRYKQITGNPLPADEAADLITDMCCRADAWYDAMDAEACYF